MSFQGSKEIMFDRVCTWRKWVLAIGVGVLATFNAARTGYAQGTWTALTIVPSALEGMTVGGVGNTIVGGYGGASTGDTNQTFLYNIASNSWSSGAAAPLPARSEAAYGEMTHAGFLYVIGGGNNSGGVLAHLPRDDPVADTWGTLTSMPTARAQAAHSLVASTIL